MTLSALQKYFLPTKPAAAVVTWVELVLFAFWLCLLAWQVYRILSTKKEFLQLQSAIPGIEEIILRRASKEFDPEFARQRFEAELPPAAGCHPAREHLWALFAAGYRDADVNTAELVLKTDEQVCSYDSALRNTVGMFVVLGLLGTLFSVADAIATLSDNRGTDVHQFLGGLSGAFAPSLTGVLLSVVCGLLYSSMLASRVKMRVVIRELTGRDWAPRLRPPITRRLEEASQRTLDAAGEVVRFADGIREYTASWKSAVEASEKAAQTIAGAMADMSHNMGQARSTAELNLNEINSQIQGLSETLGEWRSMSSQILEFRTTTERNQERQIKINEELELQARRLADSTDQLRTELSSFGDPMKTAASRLEDIASRFSGDLTTALSAAAEGFRTDNLSEWQKLSGLIKESAGGLGRSSSRAADSFVSSIDALREAHGRELTAVKLHFDQLSAELKNRSTEELNVLRGLEDSFTRAARELGDQTTTAVKQVQEASLYLKGEGGKIKMLAEKLATYTDEDNSRAGAGGESESALAVRQELLEVLRYLRRIVDAIPKSTDRAKPEQEPPPSQRRGTPGLQVVTQGVKPDEPRPAESSFNLNEGRHLHSTARVNQDGSAQVARSTSGNQRDRRNSASGTRPDTVRGTSFFQFIHRFLPKWRTGGGANGNSKKKGEVKRT